LKEKIAALEEEVSGSKQLFDTYRERARVSLQKTANEQQEVEKLLAKAKDECKQQLKRADDAMKRVNQIETEYSLAIENLKAQLEGRDGDINRLKAEIAESKSQLDTLASSVHQAPAMDKSELIKIQDELQRARDEMKGSSRKILDLEDSIEALKSREQKLIADQKKRSDAARELVETKDKEIARLEALVNDVRTPLAEHDPTTRPTLSDSIASASVVRNLQDRYRKFDYLALLAF
jgi:chromosome segregation ATPase